MKDWRGVKDLEGKALEITNEGVGDEIAGLANLMMGSSRGYSDRYRAWYQL